MKNQIKKLSIQKTSKIKVLDEMNVLARDLGEKRSQFKAAESRLRINGERLRQLLNDLYMELVGEPLSR